MSLDTEATTLLAMMLSGVVMGVLFDTYRVLGWRTAMNRWLMAICDTMFWLSCTFLVFGTLLRVNDGVVRFYLFIILFLGTGLYFFIFQSFYIKMLSIVITLVQYIIYIIKRSIHVLLVMPVLFLVQMVSALLLFLLQAVWRFLQFIGRGLFFFWIPMGGLFTRAGKILTKRGAGIFQVVKNLFKRK